MYKLLFSTFALLFGALGFINKENTVVNTQQEIISCHPLINEEGMAAFVNDPAFQALHLSPLPINYAAQGEIISFPAADGIDAKGYIIKAKKQSENWLFVYQEWWGLNDYVKKQADIFYNDLGGDVNILALDMYDGKVTTDPKEAGQYMQSAVESRLENIVKAGVAYAGKKARIAKYGG